MLRFSNRTTLRRLAFAAVFLSSTAAAADERLSTYGNARFGVFADYPSSLFTVEDAPPENGDGQCFRTADGSAELALYGSYNIDNETPENYVANRVDLAGVSYKKIGRDFMSYPARAMRQSSTGAAISPTATSSPALTFPTLKPRRRSGMRS